MKQIIFIVILMFSIGSASAQEDYVYQDTTKYYSFSINYWFNLHHFLWLESFLQVNSDSSIIQQKLPVKAQQSLKVAIDYYRENLANEDLRESEYMTAFKGWITMQRKSISSIPAEFREHMHILQKVSSTYEEYFWDSHKGACLGVLNENIELILMTEEEFVESITKLTRQFWQFEKLNVDITFVAKATKYNLRNRPYTTIFPTHVVMNAVGENDVRGNWLELLYHESAHHLILSRSYFVGGTIRDLCEIMEMKPPRQLDHAYLFYFTGILAQQLLQQEGIDYPLTYMVRNKVFSKYYPLLEKHLTPYINREITLADATKRIVSKLEE